MPRETHPPNTGYIKILAYCPHTGSPLFDKLLHIVLQNASTTIRTIQMSYLYFALKTSCSLTQNQKPKKGTQIYHLSIEHNSQAAKCLTKCHKQQMFDQMPKTKVKVPT